MALLLQSLGQVTGTFTSPSQRRLGIPSGGRIDEAVQILQQSGVGCAQRFAASARPSLASSERRRSFVHLLLSFVDRRSGQAGRFGHNRLTVWTNRGRFGSGPNPPTWLRQIRSNDAKALLDSCKDLRTFLTIHTSNT